MRPYLNWIWIISGILIASAIITYLHLSGIKKVHASNELSGKELYLTYCISCHGDNGLGIENNPPINALNIPLETFADLLKKGTPKKPKFSHIFVDGEYESLYRYVETLRN